MKTFTKVVTAAVLVGGVADAVAAFNHGGPFGPGFGPGHGPMWGPWASPEHRADHLVGHLAERLELSADQSAKLHAFKDHLLQLRQTTQQERSRGPAIPRWRCSMHQAWTSSRR